MGHDQRQHADINHRRNGDELTPIAVGERTDDDRAERDAEDTGGKDGSERAAGEPPVFGERGRDISDRLVVDAVEEESEPSHEGDQRLVGADVLGIDGFSDVDGVHGSTLLVAGVEG